MFISTPHIVFLIYTQNIDWFLRRVLYTYTYNILISYLCGSYDKVSTLTALPQEPEEGEPVMEAPRPR